MTHSRLRELLDHCHEAALCVNKVGSILCWLPLVVAQVTQLRSLLEDLIGEVRGRACPECALHLRPKLRAAEDYVRALSDEEMLAAQDRIAAARKVSDDRR